MTPESAERDEDLEARLGNVEAMVPRLERVEASISKLWVDLLKMKKTMIENFQLMQVNMEQLRGKSLDDGQGSALLSNESSSPSEKQAGREMMNVNLTYWNPVGYSKSGLNWANQAQRTSSGASWSMATSSHGSSGSSLHHHSSRASSSVAPLIAPPSTMTSQSLSTSVGDLPRRFEIDNHAAASHGSAEVFSFFGSSTMHASGIGSSVGAANTDSATTGASQGDLSQNLPAERSIGVWRLWYSEWMERKAEGLCIRCGEKFHSLHLCPNLSLRVMIWGEDETLLATEAEWIQDIMPSEGIRKSDDLQETMKALHAERRWVQCTELCSGTRLWGESNSHLGQAQTRALTGLVANGYTFELLPRLDEIKCGRGVIDELLHLDLPRDWRFPLGVMVLEYGKAVQESVYEQLRVREGQLLIIFMQDLKILSWEFCARHRERGNHEKNEGVRHLSNEKLTDGIG